MAEDILYLKLDTKVQISEPAVRIGDLGKMFCTNPEMGNKIKTLKIYRMQQEDHGRCVIGVLKVIEIVLKEFPGLTIENMGETETVVEQTGSKEPKGRGGVAAGKDRPWNIKSLLKVVFVSAVCFFGTMYTVMAYHNDVAIHDLFSHLYVFVMGEKSDGYTILELAYSIGLSLGIVIFYNHIGKRRLTPDPSPVEVEMRLYDDNVNHALIEMANREEKTIDVS
ncbi:MAG: stage V sporulation protein AA [Lachnospiraceae bacterium]|nr:stage V sporulation protein AA [Lachnospiraceae bacterium]